jgi:hypothetical protein
MKRKAASRPQLATPSEPIHAQHVLMLMPRDKSILILRPLLPQQFAERPGPARPKETRRPSGTHVYPVGSLLRR